MRGVFEQSAAPRRAGPDRPAARARQPVGQPSRRRDEPRVGGARKSPVADAGAVGTLEATFDPGCGLGEWDFQVLSMAAQLGRSSSRSSARACSSRAPGCSRPQRVRRDGAAPLIGSTPVDADAALDDRARRGHRLHGVARGRVRRRQGARGPADPRGEPSPQRSVRGDQLRGARRDAARVRAVRHRGSDGDRRPRAPRQVRGGRRRHAVPRRSVRSVVLRPRPSCCAPSRTSRSSGSAATTRIASTSGSSPRPTAGWPGWSIAGCFVPTCSTA